MRSFVGDGIRTTCQRALPEGTDDETVDLIAKAQSEFYDELWQEHTRPFAGIPELLEDLGAEGIATGVCSAQTRPS